MTNDLRLPMFFSACFEEKFYWVGERQANKRNIKQLKTLRQ